MKQPNFFHPGGEECQVNLPARWLPLLENLSLKHGATISGILRTVLANPKAKQLPEKLKRPRKFTEAMHRFPVCLHGKDKQILKRDLSHQGYELGSYLRYLLEAYGPEIEEILSEVVLKKNKAVKIEKKVSDERKRYVYQYRLVSQKFAAVDFWPYDELQNIIRMWYGRFGVWLGREEASRLRQGYQSWRFPPEWA